MHADPSVVVPSVAVFCIVVAAITRLLTTDKGITALQRTLSLLKRNET